MDVGGTVPEKVAPYSIVARFVGKDRVQRSGVRETSAILVEKLRELGVRRLEGLNLLEPEFYI